MDKSKGSLNIKFSGKDTLNLTVLTKVCNCLLNVLNKISLVTSNRKNEYSVSYSNGDGFSLVITQDNCESDTIINNNANTFNVFIDFYITYNLIYSGLRR